LQEIQSDGQPLIIHLKSIWRQSGIKPKQLELPEVNDAYLYLLNDFYQLSSHRSSNGYSPNPINYLEIDCWSRLTGKFITSSEVEIIMAIDSIYMEHYANEQQSRK
jgi:hypothetical protein